jgi:hypothetical protein
VGKHFVPFGKSGDMGDSITTQIIYHQNAMLKSTKQRVITNLNDIKAIIEMETPETATFGNNGSFTLRESFLSYRDDAGASIFRAIEATQTGGTYCFLFNENNRASVDMILTDIDEKLEAIRNWDDATVYYRYITTDDVEISSKNAQAQGKSFWQEHYKLMSGTILEVVDTNMFDLPHQRRPPVKLLPLPQPPVRARTDARTNPSAQRATQLRSVLARVYDVSIQNQITTTVP